MTISFRESFRREIDKLIARHNSKCRAATLDRRRYELRSGSTATMPSSTTPSHWEAHQHFNPYYVRSRFSKINHTLSIKLHNGTFEPNPILLVEIPKPHGGTREISLLTIPDAAISYTLGTRLIERNSHFFSSYTYAYRIDRNAHHAIQHLMTEIRGCSRLFALEFDFSKYFDSISHDYLIETLRKYFMITRRELELIRRLLRARRAHGISDYRDGSFTTPSRGIPQGSSISLFLANVACHELDREIEQTGAVFARYADDTLIVCNSYDKADACARHILDHGKRSGTEVNFTKSDGISLLSKQGNAELKTKHSIEFLAHSLSADGVGVSSRSISRIKRKVGRLINLHLLLQPTRGHVNANRFGTGFRDWDLVTCINELRRYIYGRISEEELSRALAGNGSFNITRCALLYYPTVGPEKADIFKSLDGWLVDTLARAYQRRVRLISTLGTTASPINKPDLIDGSWYSFPSVPVETRLPSFFKSWLYVRRCAGIFGLSRFPSPLYEYI